VVRLQVPVSVWEWFSGTTVADDRGARKLRSRNVRDHGLPNGFITEFWAESMVTHYNSFYAQS